MRKFESQSAEYRQAIEGYLKDIYAPFTAEPQKLIFEAANAFGPSLPWISVGCADGITGKPCPLARPWR